MQGVGFRYRAYHKARQLCLTGWVRNEYDGSVEMEVQGKSEWIDELVRFLDSQSFIVIERMHERMIPVVEDERDFYEER